MSVVLQVGSTHLNSNTTTVCNGAIDGTGESELKEWKAGQLSGFHDVKATIIKSSLPYQFVLQDHNYGAPPPPSPPPPTPNNLITSPGSARLNKSSPVLSPTVITSPNHKVNGVTTAVKQESSKVGEKTINSCDEQCGKEVVVTSVTRCICEFSHDDEYMICCDKCSVWQHVDCMGLDRSNIPETYLCERCEPRKVDKQKAKALQMKKRGQMNDSSSEESNTDGGRLARNNHFNLQHDGPVHRRFSRVHGRARRIGRRRKSSSVSCASGENGNCETIVTSPTAPNNTINKRKGSTTKEKLERKRVCERRKRIKSKTEFTHVNEETQDVVLRKWIDQYEETVTNQYSSELLLRLSGMKLNGQCEETNSIAAQLQTVKRCRVKTMDEHTKGLVATERLTPDQTICEYRGKFYLGSEFYQKNPLHTMCPPPFVLWHHLETNGSGGENVQKDKSWSCHESFVCVDAREVGNEARFVRRSCNPNAEVRHLAEKGLPRVYLSARSDILINEEITVSFDFDVSSCVGHVKCVCSRENCLVMSAFKKNGLFGVRSERKRQARKLTGNSTDGDDGSQSSVGCKKISICETSTCDNVSSNQLISPGSVTQMSSDDSQTADVGSKEEEGCVNIVSTAIDRRKMTREERKMEAIVRAFERMEKAQQRRQEAQARQQLRKGELKRKSGEDQMQTHETSDGAADLQTFEQGADFNTGQSVKTENHLVAVDEEQQSSSATTQPNLVPTACFRHKLKGRRRKTSGAPSRRSSRVNSGGSDVCQIDENSQNLPLGPLCIGVSSCSSLISTLTQSQTACLTNPESVSIPCSTVVNVSPDVDMALSTTSLSRPKTKKHLMNEWLNESLETTRSEGSVEMGYRQRSPSLVLSCPPSTPTISSNHLRKSFSGEICGKQPTNNGSMGSAKKRWLRQAMTEDQPEDLPYAASSSFGSRPDTPVTNISVSNTDVASEKMQRVLPPADLVTPLKKRRLARESDVTAPQSPMSIDAGDGSASCDSDKAIPLLRKLQQQVRIDDAEMNLPSHSSIGNASSSLSCVFPRWVADTSEECLPCGGEEYAVSSSCTNNDFEECDETLAEDLRVPDATRTRSETPTKPVKRLLMECPSSTVEDTVTSSYGASETEPLEMDVEENHKATVCEVPEEDVEMDSVQDVAVDLSIGLPAPAPCDVMVKNEVEDEAEDTCSSAHFKPISEVAINDLKSEIMSEEPDLNASVTSYDVDKEVEKATKSEITNEDLLVTVLATPPPPPPPPLPPPVPLLPPQQTTLLLNLSELVERPHTPPSHLFSSDDNQDGKDSFNSNDRSVLSPAVSSTSSTPLSSPRSTVTSPITSQTSVTPVKRKVSLLEYRQRKLENTSGSCSSSSSSSSTSNSKISVIKGKNLFDSSCSGTAVSTSLTPTSELSTFVPLEMASVAGIISPAPKVCASESDIKWDSTATSVERQRENLTQRLKREFGLMMEDEGDVTETSKVNNSPEVPALHTRSLYSVPLCAPVVGAPMMVIGSNIPTIVGIRNYGGIRTATPIVAPASTTTYPTTVYGTYGTLAAVAPTHSLAVVTATPPPPPPPPVQSPTHLRLLQLGEVPTQPVAPLSITAGTTTTILPHSFPIQGFPQIPLQLPPPPPPPLPPPPPPINHPQQHVLSSVPVSVQQIPLPKPQGGPSASLSSNSDSHSKAGKW